MELSPQTFRWLRVLASQRTQGRPEMFDDCVQEGAIVIWQVLGRWPDAPRAYVTGAVQKRMAGVLRGDRLVGAPGHQGKKDASTSVVDSDVPELGTLEVGDWSDVRDAVQSLPERDRELVFDRFWLDREWEVVAANLGLSSGRVESKWRDQIRPALRKALTE